MYGYLRAPGERDVPVLSAYTVYARRSRICRIRRKSGLAETAASKISSHTSGRQGFIIDTHLMIATPAEGGQIVIPRTSSDHRIILVTRQAVCDVGRLAPTRTTQYPNPFLPFPLRIIVKISHRIGRIVSLPFSPFFGAK